MSTPAQPNQGAPGAAADPSMEDILASIRRILSEDEPPGEPSGAGTPPHEPAPSSSDVLMLDASMMVETPDPPVARPVAPVHLEPVSDPHLDIPPPPELPPAPLVQNPVTPPPVVAAPPMAVEAPARPAAESLVAPAAAAAVASTVGSLMRHLAQERQSAVHRGGPTIEDLVREEIRPLLKEWLDAHLPAVVENLVRAEIERVVGRAVG